jgi:hypothetical protein
MKNILYKIIYNKINNNHNNNKIFKLKINYNQERFQKKFIRAIKIIKIFL